MASLPKDQSWHNRFAQQERMGDLLRRFIREDDVQLTDREFVKSVWRRFDNEFKRHIVDVNE